MNKHFLSLLLGGALMLSPLVVRAQTTGPIGQIISYQGQLSNAGGTPIADGTTSLTFKIYEAGTEKSSQTMSVATFGGVFNTFLSVGALTFDPTKSYELGITFNGTETRHPIAAVPVALSAATAGSVSGVVAVANGGTGSATQNFVDLTTAQTVAGAKTFGSAVTAPQFNIGADRVLGASPGGRSVFLGPGAGAANGGALYNVLLGGFAGNKTTGGANIFVGDAAGANNTSGSGNIAIGDSAGINWTTGSNNIAIRNGGVGGESNTTRIGGGQTRAFIAGVRGATGLTGTLPVVVDASGQLGTTAALSADTLSANTVSANTQFNLAGDRVLFKNNSNLLVGPGIAANPGGDLNTVVGVFAGRDLTSGQGNTFLGAQAGAITTTGTGNTYLGAYAGTNNAAGGSNIAIGNGGVAGENSTTRIGSGQTRAFLAGVRGVAVAGTAVIIDANGQLGTVNSSSARFKQDVKNIGAGSDWLLKLRPVSYRYTPQFLKSDAPSPVQYGLIAEEVAKVAPQMVQFNAQGQAEGIKYGDLPVMLLSQLQKQQAIIEALQARLKKLEAKN